MRPLGVRELEELLSGALPERRRVVNVTQATNCLRWSYLEAKGEKPTEPTAVVFLNYLGRLGRELHRAVEEVLDGAETEKSLSEDLGCCTLRGRADVVYRGLVVEVKTYTAARTLPKPHHVAQLLYYMQRLGAERGLLLYASRVRPEYRGFLFDHVEDAELVRIAADMVRERARRLWRAIETGEPPEPEPWIWCRYCPYRRTCPAARLAANGPWGRLAEALNQQQPAASLIDFLD